MAAPAGFLGYLRIPVAASSAIAATLSGLLYWKQNELIYPRSIPPNSRTEVPRPTQNRLQDSEELMIPTPDGEKLSAFLIRPSNSAHPGRKDVTVLMFHGNAGNIGHRLPIAEVLDYHIGCNVLMLEYRGYGLSTGTPDEKGLNIDAQAGLDYIRQRKDLQGTKVVVYGQSLGGAVSIQLVARNQEAGDVKALILENTFLSIKKLIPHAFPPAKYLSILCHQIWPSEETIPKIKCPVLFLSGSKDEIVPSSHMARLHQVCTSPNKYIKLFEKGTHNDTVACQGYFGAIADFIEEHVPKDSGSRL